MEYGADGSTPAISWGIMAVEGDGVPASGCKGDYDVSLSVCPRFPNGGIPFFFRSWVLSNLCAQKSSFGTNVIQKHNEFLKLNVDF
jgi:hypothetical protein